MASEKDERRTLDRRQLAVARRAVADAIEWNEAISRGVRIPFGPQAGRLVENGVYITALIGRRLRDYKKLLNELRGGH